MHAAGTLHRALQAVWIFSRAKGDCGPLLAVLQALEKVPDALAQPVLAPLQALDLVNDQPAEPEGVLYDTLSFRPWWILPARPVRLKHGHEVVHRP